MGKADFYKYFVTSKNDINTGFYIGDVGKSTVNEGEEYPLKHHPSSHYFKWEKGRFLKEFQILLITKGKGTFQSKNAGKLNLLPGSIFLLFPNEWHRYRPMQETGWEEYWVGFNGKFANKMIEQSPFSLKKPVIHVKNSLALESLFQEIITYSKKERPGYQQIIAGLVLQILGQVQSSARSKSFYGKPIEDKIDKARIILSQNLNTSVDLKKMAEELNISYSLFRKRFKEFTGVSPKQYFMQLKIKHAQDLLLNSSLPIQSISYETGFENQYHFSKAFKEKTGYSPTEFRRVEME